MQVAILETGKLELMVVVGVVNEGYDTSRQPGLKDGTVGYYTNGDIYVAFVKLGTKGILKNGETELSVNLITVKPR